MVLNKKQALLAAGASAAFALLAAPGAAMAQKTAPLSFAASPEVYKVIDDGKDYRIIHNVPAGAASVRPPVPSQEAQNIGSSICKAVLFEPK